MTMADRIVVMSKGHVEQAIRNAGRCLRSAAHARYIADFIRRGENFFEGTVEGAGGGLLASAAAAASCCRCQRKRLPPSILAVRPRRIAFVSPDPRPLHRRHRQPGPPDRLRDGVSGDAAFRRRGHGPSAAAPSHRRNSLKAKPPQSTLSTADPILLQC